MTAAENKFAIVLQQIAHCLMPLPSNSVVINYQTGDVTVSLAGASNAMKQRANARVQDTNLSVDIDNAAQTATIHAPRLATAIDNLTLQNAQAIKAYMEDELGYTISVDRTAKTVTVGWAPGS